MKNHEKTNPSDYDSALLGLAYHVSKSADLQKEYLHTTRKIDFGQQTFFEYLKKMNVTLYFNDLNCFNHLDKYGNNNATTNPYYFKMALIAVDNENYLNSIKQFTNNKELLTYVNKMVDLYKSLFKDKNDFIMKMLSFPHFEELGFFLDEDERIFYNQCLKRYEEIKDELIDGTTLISWGFKADKNFGKILEYVKKRQIEGLKIEDIRAEIMKIFTKN